MSLVGVPAGIVIDEVLGEPPDNLHPVIWFGKFARIIEGRVYRDSRTAGLVLLGACVCVSGGAGLTIRRVLGSAPSVALAVAICSAGRMLDREALSVAEVLESDIEEARSRLSRLVGRDTSNLDEPEISRAVIETVAENSVDAVTASIFWGAIAGSTGTMIHRAVNTLDAMYGHLTPAWTRFGWASARLDDFLNYLPARMTAVAVAGCRPSKAAVIWSTIASDARRHPSPNGGVIEAAYAAALGVRLGGMNSYAGVLEDRGHLGTGRAPVLADIPRAVRLRRQSTAFLLLSILVMNVATNRLRR